MASEKIARQVAPGERFGLLVVEGRGPDYIHAGARVKRHKQHWCRCACGGLHLVPDQRLKSGHTQSCGCGKGGLITARKLRHGKTKSPEYKTWIEMRNRCSNPDVGCWHNYGGRGIRVCQRWDASFEAFLEDMGPRPSLDHSIDRIDMNGNYEPGNCRWATRHVQSRNRRTNRFLKFDGRLQTLTDWAAEVGVSPSRLTTRLNAGWSVERTLTTPSARSRRIVG